MPNFAPTPLVSFIVPVYQTEKAVFQRCLRSLQDQDYENIEVVCVFDGIQPELLKVITPFLSDKRFRVVEIDHAGACAARNAGFKTSNGEIISFFNSDYIAKPGMVRAWVEMLQANADCGFAYGRYEYNSSRREVYPSKPFDPWTLKIANYIDCGCPLWRQYVVDWDPNCKSLQDWDFWLRVIETHKVKGYYWGALESFYIAELPKRGGLSDDSHSNWLERTRYVKAKNGIPESDICVTSRGAPNHAVEIAKMLNVDFRDDTIFKQHAYKALYLIGWYMKPTDQGNDHPLIMMAFDQPGIKKIIHFVGADIFWLRKFSYEHLKQLVGALKMKADYILCETELARDELRDFGINARIVPIPSYSTWEVKPLPESFSVSIFLTNKSDFDKYCYEENLSIVRAMPDVQFTAYGDGGWDVEYPNLVHCRNLPRPEWEKYVYSNSCYLRLVRHDTLPLASAEFVMAGRDVITNIPLPYQEYIDTAGKDSLNDWDKFSVGLNLYHWPDTKSQIIQKIRELRKRHLEDEKRIEAAKYWNDLLNKDKYIETIRALALGKEDQNADIKHQAAAIGGH